MESLGGLREEEGFCEGLTLRVFGGRFREDKGGFGMFLIRAIGRTAKKVKREEMKVYKHNCTVPYPGVDKVKVKVNVGVKVNIRHRLGEETPSASIAEAGRCREEASPR